MRHISSSKRLPENALVMTHSNFCVIFRGLFLEPVCSATNSSASENELFSTNVCGAAAPMTDRRTEALPRCNLLFAKSRYYLWRHKHVHGKRLASKALLFVALQRLSRKRAHSVCSASVSEALLCGYNRIVTKCSLRRAPICGATKHAS